VLFWVNGETKAYGSSAYALIKFEIWEYVGLDNLEFNEE
jgi:hypothetical protein